MVSYRGARVEVVSLRSDSPINVSDRYIDLEGIKEEIKKHYTYRPLSSLGFMDDSQDGRSDVNFKSGRMNSIFRFAAAP